MRQLYLLLIFVIYVTSAFGQTPQEDRMNFEPGELIIKLKDEVNAKLKYSSAGKTTSSLDLKAFLDIDADFEKVSVMFSEKSIKKSLDNKKKMMQKAAMKKSVNPNDGSIAKLPVSLKNIFKVKLKNTQDPSQVLKLIEDVKQNPDVEFAEPNYRFSINDFTIDSEILTEEDLKSIKREEKASSSLVPNDALYSQQTNISDVNIDKVWESGTTGDGSQVIAILDTGVDYNHPDLKDNIWINEAELNGVEGFDDDGNGYVDDIYGWDFINLDAKPLDDNMHGTHVAGIAGAAGNNELGIAGAAWNVKLMPVKVFQSNGVGNASTIAEGIEYAANNGATVINMSFGTYAESLTMKAALDNAYATAVLVASAGNDGRCIGPGIGCVPSYPAAYTFVLGVEDAAPYSNFDQDGPIYSGYSNLLNYEVKAPGTGILSTVPNGGYRNLTGTSMSAPLLAGGIALYLENKPEDSKELIFGNLINTSNTYVDFLEAINVVPTPELKVLSAMTKDTLSGQNGNGFLEPGEIIDIFPLVKNYWGPTEDVRVGIEFVEFEDTTKATILTEEIAIGSITAYASLQNLEESLKIEIADNVANNVNIRFIISVWSGDNQEYLSSKEVVINVKNSILLFGVYYENLTLDPSREYLVSDQLVMAGNSTLTIPAGTVLKFSEGVRINMIEDSKLVCNGAPGNMIQLIPEGSYSWAGIRAVNQQPHEISFTKFIFAYKDNGYILNTGPLSSGSDLIFTDCITTWGFISNGSFDRVNYVDNYGGQSFQDNTFIGEFFNIIKSPRIRFSNSVQTQKSNIFSNNSNHVFTQNITDFEVYLGNTTNLKKEINDISTTANGDNGSATGFFNTQSVSMVPYEDAHAIVWKVLVNGKDAQDEYELMDPVGVGTHEFQVYFNRTMDTLVDPQVSYGVREPYNQKIISEEGSWSADGKIYTVNHEVKIGAADGINRIRVQDAQDLDYFKIPVEDMRFNMLLQSAGSASTGFFATPGLGKIELDWEEPTEEELTDVLGYNMFRYQIDAEGNETETMKLNESLITTSEFADFEVTEGETYFYKYKILRTSLEETDFSQTISTQPLTSVLGDSNGDFGVNVMDVIQNVDYILGHNPKPFILQAADVNNDGSINVLDVVGVVDIILNPDGGTGTNATTGVINYYPSEPVGKAVLSWEGDDLYIESEHQIGGLQLSISSDFDYTVNEELSNLERLNYEQDGNDVLMLYSFNNVSFGEGKVKLLTRSDAAQEMEFVSAVVSTVSGSKLEATFEEGTLSTINAPQQLDTMDFGKLYPNPSNGLLNIEYYLPGQVETVNLSIYNLQGQLVFSNKNLRNVSGMNIHRLNLGTISGGVYVVVLNAMNNGRIAHRQFKKLVIK